MTVHNLPLGKQYPDMTERFVELERRHERQSLEHTLATAFVSMQGTYNPGERQGYWLECLRLAKEIEKLNANGNHNEPTATIPDGKNTAD